MSECDRIIRRLARKLAELKNDCKTSDLTVESSVDLVANLTGLHVKAITEIDTKGPSIDLNDVDRSMIYSALCRFYIRNRNDGGKVPTTYQLFDIMVKHNALPNKMDIGSFRKLLLKMGFIWKKVEGRTPVVIEKPSIRFERFKYLTQMKRCRVERYDDIFYVDEFAFNQRMVMDIEKSWNFEKETGLWQVRRIHAVGRNAIICQKEIKDFSAEVYEDWVENELIPYLAVPSVIVVKDIPHHNAKIGETPTLLSSRTDMMKWLDYFGVPFDAEMSKYELFSLAEELTDLNTELYKVDEILKSHGHKLMRIPNSVGDSLSPAFLIFNVMVENLVKQSKDDVTKVEMDKSKVKLRLERVLRSAVDHLQRFSSSVIANEQKMLNVEKDVDKQLDVLMMQRNLLLGLEGCERDDSDVASCDSD